ncbi:alpha-L-arabinofuranosidase B-domain-containing protein [Aspergillus cavernicola]|uniref:Alpha-L-arabinofuranosidase n=1 Tax=Aspergillus cavernicola TaxID=176166 RepID=A0ABR4IG57_9EURO
MSDKKPQAEYHPPKGGILSKLPPSVVPYAELLRIHRPLGYYLNISPYVVGIAYTAAIAPTTIPPTILLNRLLLLSLWGFLIRSGGCVWNDLIDADIDRQISRTRLRPIPRGAVSNLSAVLLTAAIFSCGGSLLFLLPPQCTVEAGFVLFFALLYPFGKRFTDHPQLILVNIAWAIPMAMSSLGVNPLHYRSSTLSMCSFIASVIVMIDVVYASQDAEEDMKIGVRSMAVQYRATIDYLAYCLLFFGTLSLLAGLVATGSLVAPRPCDIYSSGDAPCIAAHSTTRALYSAYTGPLYQVKRGSDGARTTIAPLSAGGVANASAQVSFCASTTCLITMIYDQSGCGNHPTQAPPGGFSGPESNCYDNLASAIGAPVTLTGHAERSEGVMASGYPSDTTENSAQANIMAAKYAMTSLTSYHACCTTRYIAHTGSTINTQVVSSSSNSALKQQSSWTIRTGLTNSACFSFESNDTPDTFIRHYNFELLLNANDGAKQFYEDATFCPQVGLNGQGNSLRSWSYPTRYFRHYNDVLYAASNGGVHTFDATTSFTDDVSWVINAGFA